IPSNTWGSCCAPGSEGLAISRCARATTSLKPKRRPGGGSPCPAVCANADGGAAPSPAASALSPVISLRRSSVVMAPFCNYTPLRPVAAARQVTCLTPPFQRYEEPHRRISAFGPRKNQPLWQHPRTARGKLSGKRREDQDQHAFFCKSP